MRDDRGEILATFDFPPDRFQVDAFDAFDDGKHVVVAAPTGSGKTVVAEYAIAAAVRDGQRAFYTTPVKALSNQKYRDLVAVHGADSVGLLTGDNAINADAAIVVMTTEVLRNMVYAGRTLDDLGVVVLDEVHFLQDTYRGPVWEEVMIHAPQHVRLVCLSATVTNVQELADWIETVRGPAAAIIETKRPVALNNRYFVADRTTHKLHLMPTFVGGGVNRDALKLDESAIRGGRRRDFDGRNSGRRGGDAARGSKGSGARRLATPSRIETVERLEAEGLLPAIFFIFSRNQCDEAARSCLDAGLRLTSADEQIAIRAIIDGRLGDLDPDDLDVLGYGRFVEQLEAGIAAHHAGMVPAMKETVEACFVAGFVKVVFATETLAVGINMPARSVVIEKLTKFTGEHHERLTPGEYTQLTGRAGRRGLDEVGDAIVLWTPWVRFDEVAQLASSSSFHLRSAFRPTYNMAANLIRTHSSEESHRLLNLSFAQYQADRDVVKIEARLERKRQKLDELRAEAVSPFGDIDEYRQLRRAEADNRRERRDASAGQMRGALAKLRPGSIIRIAKGDHKGPVVVVANAHRKSGVKLTLVTKGGDLLSADADDFIDLPEAVGSIKLPKHFGPQRKDYRREVAKRLRTANVGSDRKKQRRQSSNGARSDEHPVARDPDLRARVDAAGRADRVEFEMREMRKRISGKNDSLSQEFDRVLQILERFGYADVEAWTLTPQGETLARIFHESDLLVAELISDGLFDGLTPADLAALAACVVYEHRSPEPPPAPWFSSHDVRDRWKRLDAISADLRAIERSLSLSEHRAPDPTFAAIAHAWVAGEGFAEIVGEEELTGGDFVRNIKQLIDLLRQIATVAPDPSTRRRAADAVTAAFRGVVADSSAPGA
jgi:ATP-dependent RNA helicase HelY